MRKTIILAIATMFLASASVVDRHHPYGRWPYQQHDIG